VPARVFPGEVTAIELLFTLPTKLEPVFSALPPFAAGPAGVARGFIKATITEPARGTTT